jgi:nucleotide-binding universal stress UspA family protein
MRLLIAYDGSECADAALDDLRRAGMPEAGEALVLSVARVWPAVSEMGLPETSLVAETEHAKMLATGAADRVRADLPPGWKVEPLAMVHSPHAGIVEKADEWSADLVLLGSHGRSALGRALMGSVSQSVLTHATCSVRIGRRRGGGERGSVRLVIGVDGSVESATAVAAVTLRRWPAGSEARVVAVVEVAEPLMKLPLPKHSVESAIDPSHHRWVTHAVERVARELREAGLVVSPLVCEGDPKRMLVEECERWDADCIFVGAKGRSRLDRFLLGSVSLAVAARARCSVEVVRKAP